MDYQVGDRVVVYSYGHDFPIIIKEIRYLPNEARHVLLLDWGTQGTSRVYDHDQGKVWHQLKDIS